jgi:hypothetical protein
MAQGAQSRRPTPSKTAAKVRRYQAPRRRARPTVWIIPAVIAALLVVVLIAVAQRRSQGPQATAAETAAVVAQVTSVPSSAWDSAAATNADVPVLIPAADRPTGAPTLLYMGAEFCPYCATLRWPLVAALARFGTWSGLRLTTSSSTDIYPNTPTFALDKATFASPYIQVQTVEMEGRAAGADGAYPTLQKPTAIQQSLIDKYDAPPYVPSSSQGSIPFVLVGGTYIWSGIPFAPGLQGRSWTQVSGILAAATDPLARQLLADGNEISAAICAVDGGQPASVCTSSGVQAAAATLPKAAQG